MKIKALFQIVLIVGMLFSVYTVEAADVCCERTVNGGSCEYVDQSQCVAGFGATPTSCDQVSYCQPSCCYDQNGDGYCYANYPRAACEAAGGLVQTDPTCESVDACTKGCCIIGTQAAFVTEVRCKAESAIFPDLAMDFRKDVLTEAECLDIVRSAEQGCCVNTDGTCTYTTKGSCEIPLGEKSGFFTGKFCSQLDFCNCAPANPEFGGSGNLENTGCLDNEDNVYWFDSCGNQEGIKEECDYGSGFLCGDSDENDEYTCENLNCFDTSTQFEDYTGTSVDELGEITNGESWCMYDNEAMDEDLEPGGKDPIGSRYYRAVCINGKEVVEPCSDYRKEFCVDGTADIIKKNDEEGQLTEARCVENVWDLCNECNTADSFSMDEQDYSLALAADEYCCSDRVTRDCSWMGRCVPKVSPGFKFWEAEGADVCNQATATCPVVMFCNGWNSLLGTCDESGMGGLFSGLIMGAVGAIASGLSAGVGTVASAGAIAGSVFGGGLSSGVLAGVETGAQGWILVSGKECLSEEYLQAVNNICRAQGDCGADFNFLGDKSIDGFVSVGELNEDTEYYQFLVKELEKQNEGKDYLNLTDPDWEKGTTFFDGIHEQKDPSFEQKYLSFVMTTIVGSLGASVAGGLAYGAEAGAKEGLRRGGGPLGLLVSFLVPAKDNKAPLVKAAGESLDKNAPETPATETPATETPKATEAPKTPVPVVPKASEITVPTPVPRSNTLELRVTKIDSITGKIVEVVAEDDKPLTTVPLSESQDATRKEQIANEAEKISTEESAYFRQKADVDLNKDGKIDPNEKDVEIEGYAHKDEKGDWIIDEATGVGKSVALGALTSKLQGMLLGEQGAKSAVESATKEATERMATQSASGAGSIIGSIFNGIAWSQMLYGIVDLAAAQTKVIQITGTCSPWVAPRETDRCEECNPNFYIDEDETKTSFRASLACSEYRCKSLGQSCELLNKGTEEETCVSISKYDANSPTIVPWIEAFDENYRPFIKEVSGGLEVTQEYPIYSTIKIGIQTNEPSQCKMSFEHSQLYDDMPSYYFGGSNYNYFHEQLIAYPDTKNVTDGDFLELTKGGSEYQIFIRCVDAVGNSNDKDYVIKMYVSKEPDLTAPVILSTSVGQEVYINSGVNDTEMTVFTNEPSECRWSWIDQKYTDMPDTNTCKSLTQPDVLNNYDCLFSQDGSGNMGQGISGINLKGGQFKDIFVKCQDFAGNYNMESYKVRMKGSDALKITNVLPKGDIFTSERMFNVTLQVGTDGGAELEGQSICKFTSQETLKNNVQGMDSTFITTGNVSIHEQPLYLVSGQHTFYVGCYDVAGNVVYNQTSFSILADTTAPIVQRVYEDTSIQPSIVNVELNEDGLCQYSIDEPFNYGEGIDMIKDGNVFKVQGGEPRYYIACRDVYENNMNQVTIDIL